jgi:hypothetical protein
MNELEQQRQMLMAESEHLRREIAGGLATLETAATWVDRGYSLAMAVRNLWPMIAGVAGFLIARKRGGVFSQVARILSLWRLLRKLQGLWDYFSSPSSASEPKTG